MADDIRTSHEDFYALYRSREHTVTGGAASAQVAASRAARNIRRWPLEVLTTTAPDSLPHTIEGLDAVLDTWDARLQRTRTAPQPPAPTERRVSRRRTRPTQSEHAHWGSRPPSCLPLRQQPHSLRYWNGSGAGRGLRRFG